MVDLEPPRTSMVLRGLASGVLAIVGAFLTYVAVMAPWALGDEKGNITGGGFPNIVLAVGLVAGLLCAGAFAVWRPGNGRLALLAFGAVAAIVAASFGLAWLVF